MVLGPATRGAAMVGIPEASTVRRTTRSACWTAIQAAAPSGCQIIATGFVMNSRGAGVVARLIPWFRLSGAVRRTVTSIWPAVTSSRVAGSKTDTRPWAFELNRNGPFGDAPVLTTYARDWTGWMAIAASWFGKALVAVANVWGLVEATAGTRPKAGARRPLELKPVTNCGANAIGFGAPRTVFVAAEIATTRPSRWSSCPSSRKVLPGRS